MRSSAHLRVDESSTCVCLRLREQCLRSEITSVARVAHVLLLHFVARNMDVNTPASKRSQLIGNSDCSKALHNPQKIDLSVLASFSCSVYAETQGRKVRPVAGLTDNCIMNIYNVMVLDYRMACNVSKVTDTWMIHNERQTMSRHHSNSPTQTGYQNFKTFFRI